MAPADIHLGGQAVEVAARADDLTDDARVCDGSVACGSSPMTGVRSRRDGNIALIGGPTRLIRRCRRRVLLAAASDKRRRGRLTILEAIFSRRASRAFSPGAISAFRREVYNCFSMRRCALPTAPSCSAKWPAIPAGQLYFPCGTPDPATSAARRSISAQHRSKSRGNSVSSRAMFSPSWRVVSTASGAA